MSNNWQWRTGTALFPSFTLKDRSPTAVPRQIFAGQIAIHSSPGTHPHSAKPESQLLLEVGVSLFWKANSLAGKEHGMLFIREDFFGRSAAAGHAGEKQAVCFVLRAFHYDFWVTGHHHTEAFHRLNVFRALMGCLNVTCGSPVWPADTHRYRWHGDEVSGNSSYNVAFCICKFFCMALHRPFVQVMLDCISPKTLAKANVYFAHSSRINRISRYNEHSVLTFLVPPIYCESLQRCPSMTGMYSSPASC